MATPITSSPPRLSPHVGNRRHFLRHLLEMTAAMMVGMAAAVPVLWAIFAAIGVSTTDEASARYPELVCLMVAAGMLASMVAWMRHRGHRRRACAEMAAAMVVPLVPIFGLLWAGIVPGESACGLYCVAMVPAMVAAMLLRRAEYSGTVGRSA